jgi:hypothetical protein
LSARVPTLHRETGYDFGFFSADRPEPPHVHVRGNGGSAKVWLMPRVRIANTRGYDVRRRNMIEGIIQEHRDDWIARWRRHFGHR